MINKLRLQYPDYDDMDDATLMDAMHRTHYADMPREQFDACCCCDRPNHDDLEAAAVTGEDSLSLQEMDPSIKPAVKMTAEQLKRVMPRVKGKVTVIWAGNAYIIDPAAIDPTEAVASILSGNDSAILGYPERGPYDAAVTKQGELVLDLPTMKRHAMTGNIMWAASGDRDPLMEKANKVAAVLRAQGDRQPAKDGNK